MTVEQTRPSQHQDDLGQIFLSDVGPSAGYYHDSVFVMAGTRRIEILLRCLVRILFPLL